MSDDEEDPTTPILRLVKQAKDQRTAEEKKADYYKNRSNKQKSFYAKARISTVQINYLREALLTSVVIDNDGKVLIDWTEDIIDSILDSVKDPGPKKR